jgi:MFS family permease
MIKPNAGVVVGRAVTRFGETKTLAFGLIMVGLGLAAIGGVDHITTALGLASHNAEGGASLASLGFYAFGGMMMAGGNGLTNATLSALVSRVSSEQEQGLNMGIKESSSALARVTGPMVAGPLFEHVDPGAPLLLGSFVALINVKLALLLGRRMQRE